MRVLATVSLLLLAGCGLSLPTGLDATTDVEVALLDRTGCHSTTLGFNVKGRIVESDPWGQPGDVNVVGRLHKGVAYYIRPMVERYVSVETQAGHETADNVAGHEVCHTKIVAHNLMHWECMVSIAAPTYPRPTAARVWLGDAYVRIPGSHDGTFEVQ
jgi:hypothetical protein